MKIYNKTKNHSEEDSKTGKNLSKTNIKKNKKIKESEENTEEKPNLYII